MGNPALFRDVLEAADQLSLEDQEALSEVLSRRITLVEFGDTEAILLKTIGTHEEVY